jgi:protein-L-isoaspartate(D-aspartate) O-methyltransferase
MVDGSEKYRSFFAKLICTAANLDDPRIEQAFRSVKHEPFAGQGPWWLNLGPHRYVQTPDDDPAFPRPAPRVGSGARNQYGDAKRTCVLVG